MRALVPPGVTITRGPSTSRHSLIGPGDVLAAESFEDVHGPEFPARSGVEARQPPVGVQMVQATLRVRTAGPRSRVGGFPGPPVLRPPQDFPVEVEGEDDEVVAHVARDVQPLADDDRRGPSCAQSLGLPQQGGTGGGPAWQQAFLLPICRPGAVRATGASPARARRSGHRDRSAAAAPIDMSARHRISTESCADCRHVNLHPRSGFCTWEWRRGTGGRRAC